MATATGVALSLHLNWSRWFHCESSFDLSLVPETPGLCAVGREEDDKGRKLSILHVDATDNLFHALNRVFAADSPLRSELDKGRCVVRFAEVADPVEREGALNMLENWLSGRVPVDAKSATVESFLSTEGIDPHPFRGKSD